MSSPIQLSRRTILRGLGTAISLPLLEAMLPRGSEAAVRTAVAKLPTRIAWIYVPNGVHQDNWNPQTVGPQFEMPPTLEVLKDYRKDMLVLSGLAQKNAAALGDGPGDHARSMATFLTGVHPRKTDGADIQAGQSADQVAAERIGQTTPFPSLELGCEHSPQAGGCDSGYSCAYTSNMSWRTESTPVAKEINPRAVFDRLFSGVGKDSEKSRSQIDRYQKSVLDFALEDAARLQRQVGRTDRRKLDEYLTSIRDVENRLARSEKISLAGPLIKRPDGIPHDVGEHMRLMFDLLALAFQTDQTRVATVVLANESSNRSYPSIGVNDGHHESSHHGDDPKKIANIAKINKFHMEQFAYFLGKLKKAQEGSASLLDRSMICYGSGIGDGDKHNHDELPIVVVGQGSGTLRPGRHVRFPKETPLNNLWLSLLDRLGAPTDKLGDSNGRLTGLDG